MGGAVKVRKAVPVRPALSTPELARRWLRASNPDDGKVWRALMLLQQGYGPTKVALIVGVHRNSVRSWRDAFNREGAAFVPPRAPRPTAR